MRSTQQPQQNNNSFPAIMIGRRSSSSCSPSAGRLQKRTFPSSSSVFLQSLHLVMVVCWLFSLPVVSSQSDYLLTKEVLNYIDVVAQLMEHTTKQDLNSQLSDIATGIGFSTLSFLWEAPSDADVSNFAQVILGRKDTTCYAVFHGLSIDDNDAFVSNPKPISNLRRPNCNIGTDVCACRAHWTWVDVNFPTYWQDVHAQLDTCMESCALRNNNEQCDLVFGGHGAGGAVAALLSFHFAASNPYVITAGSPDVMYNSNCQGINEDRYFRFINTDTPGKDVGSDGAFVERLYLYGVCFDEIPFTNGSSELRGLGTTIAMGLEKGGMAIATGGTGQLNTLEDEATRTSLCRSAHDMLSYKQKMQSAVWRDPLGVTPVGFSNFQYCEVDQDCRAVSTCEASDDYPICTDNSVVVAPPTPFPTTRSPTTPRPSPRPSPSPTTPRPTARPTPLPTTTPFPTPKPSPSPTTPRPTARPTPLPTTPRPSPEPTTPGPTRRPTPRPTTPTPRPSPGPTPKPSSGPTPRPSPGPTGEPTTAEPTKSATDSPTWPPTVSPTNQPSNTPTLAPITPQPTRAEVITERPTTVTTTPSPTVSPTASPSWIPTVPTPEEATGAPTSSAPSPSPSSLVETTNGNNNASPTINTMAPSAGKTDFVNTRQPTETPGPSTAGSQVEEETSPTSSPTTILMTKPPAEYDSNDSKDTAPTQEPVVTPPPTWSTSALPLFDAFFRTTLVLRDVREELTGFTMFWWEDETSDHLRQWINQHTEENNWDPPIVQLRVQTNIVSQSVLFVSAPTTDVERTRNEAAATTISSILEVQDEEKESQKEEMKKDKKSDRSGRKRSKNSRRVRHRHHQRRRGRRLQTTTTTTSTSTKDVAESLQIVFEIAIAYRTLNVGDLDLHGLILEAFQNEEGRKRYGKRLQQSNDPVFENLSDFILQIEESPNNSVETALEGEDDGGNARGGEDKTIIWALIGAAGAAVVLSLGMFLWYLKRVSNKKGRQKLDDYNSHRSNGFVDNKAIFEPASGSNERLSPDGTKSPRLSQEIVVDQSHDDGISTLGDPTFYPGQPPMLQDEQTASVNYAQNYLKMHDRYDDNNRTFRSDQYSSARSMMKDTVISGGAGGSLALTKVGSGLSHLNGSAIFSDDDSFEQAYESSTECFKVLAPPGKLGIIIDLSGNGEPMVRAIRGDSTLADQVQIGDLLLSVDGETVAEMSPEQVSKLIAVKSNQPVREIMFVRRPADYR